MKTIIFAIITVLLFSCTITEVEETTITVPEKNDYHNINFLYIDVMGAPDTLYGNATYSHLPRFAQYASLLIGVDSLKYDKDSMTVEIYNDGDMFVRKMTRDDLIGYVNR